MPQEMIAAGWSEPDVAAKVRGYLAGWFTLLTSVSQRESERVGGLGPFEPAENAALMGLVAWLWKGQILLAVIVAVALVVNMVVAAVVGVVIPLLLRAFQVDPAIASSVIITTFTDVCGFFSFLGLATLLITFLL